MGFKRVQEFISGNGAAQTAHHTSLPSAEEEEALRERGRIASNDVGLASRSLPSLAILRVNRWLVGLFDMFESSLGGSELNSMWWTRRKAGDTKRCGVTCPMSGSSSDGGRSSTSCGEATMMESSIRVHLVSRSNLTTPPQEDCLLTTAKEWSITDGTERRRHLRSFLAQLPCSVHPPPLRRVEPLEVRLLAKELGG